MSFFSEELTEQERVRIISGMIAICSAVESSNHFDEIIENAQGIEVPSMDTANLLGIPLHVVNSALENLQDEGHITIEGIDEIEDITE
jgi:hypothetical protein